MARIQTTVMEKDGKQVVVNTSDVKGWEKNGWAIKGSEKKESANSTEKSKAELREEAEALGYDVEGMKKADIKELLEGGE